MDILPIAELRPELPELNSKRIKAVVSLVWPYSSAQREFALLLAEPDFRLRLKKGQTRVRFTKSCAKAIASTGIGIGDTVILGLQGVQFVEKDAGITTPGRSIDWELVFSQTLVVQILRDGNEIANLSIVNATPTPAQSPARRMPHATPTQTPLKNSSLQLGDGPRWSSPAFLKRSRLSDGPFFEAGHDPLAANEDAHDRKRRRKSYKDWNVWTYSKRTPSPEKEDPAQEDLANSPTHSPIRQPSLPATPVSPAKPQLCSLGGIPIQRLEETESRSGHEEEDGSQTAEVDDAGFGIREVTEKKAAERKATTEDFERDADYYDLYAGPDELPPEDTQYTFGGDTEENTEVEEDAVENAIERQGIIELSSPTEADSNESDDEQDIPEESKILSGPPFLEAENQQGTLVSSTEEDSINEIDEMNEEYEFTVGSTPDHRIRKRPGTHEDPTDLDDDDEPAVMPPPPKLSFLQIAIPARAPGALTPIGNVPRSPTLRPLDSSTLPMPSPFPGDRDGQLTSYLDRPSSSQPAQQEAQEPSSEASYIVESSFYSSVSAADARAGLPHHESAFTDVRFTFGMDGSTFSRLKTPSESLPPQDIEMEEDEEYVREHVDTQVAVENHSEVHGNREEHVAIHQDMFEEAEQNFTLDQENKENIFQGESESNIGEENVENSGVAGEIADEVQGKAAVEQEFALQNEMEQQLPSDMFDEFTNQDASLADHDTATSLLTLSQTQLPPCPPTQPQPTQSEVIVLSSDLGSSESSESELDEDSNESESESEAEVQSDAEMIDEAEYDTDPDQYAEDDVESIQNAGTTDVFSDEPTTMQEERPVFSDDRPIYSRRLPILSDDQQELDEEEPLPNYPDSITPNNPAITVEIIDLGSGSEDDSDNELPARRESVVVLNDALINEVVGEQSTVSHALHSAHVEVQSDTPIELETRGKVRPSAVAEGSSESAGAERAPVGFTAVNVVNEEQDLHNDLHIDQTATNAEYYEDDQFMAVDDEEDGLMSDASSTQDATQEPEREIPETLDLHPDIKMETIEDQGPFQMIPLTSSQPEDEDEDSVMGPPAELVIEVPEEGNKIGALTKKAVAATAPARNTRSKTKPSMSPIKDETHAPRSSTRSRRSKTSLTAGPRSSLPSVDARLSRSTVSPARDAMPASPYSLRSQSKFLSPIKSILSPNITVERGSSHRKRRGRQHSDPPSSPLADSFGKPEQGRFQMDFPDEFDYQPSQELGTQTRTQGSGKYANVAYVKDSEEGSMHSEHSITTASAPWSEDAEAFRVPDNHDDPVTQIRDGVSMPSKSPPSTKSPHKPKRKVYGLSSDSEAEAEGSTTPKALSVAGQVVHPDLPPDGEGERDRASRSSSPLAELDFSWTQVVRAEAEAEHIPSSPPPTRPTFASINRHSLMDSIMPLTPNPTQSFTQSQPSFSIARKQVEQSMPITPQLTQRTSAGLRSFKATYEMDVELSTADGEVFAELRGQPAPLTKSTPRRNTTGADIASPERSPSVHSEDLSDSDGETKTLVNADLEPPSIGLSTPVSYYTPLKDLRYFLNRSSQFVENPDVLALVVSSSTLPKKADKGPKHWSTTISITDLSSFPTTTTVQLFRPYAKALPVAEKGDVILLRSFTVKSLNRKIMLRSGEESAWCVWRYGKPVWGHKKSRWGEVQAREEIRGPEVEKGADEWGEVERIRGWWLSTVRQEFEAKDQSVAEHETHEANGDGVDDGKGKTKANEVEETNGVEATNGDAET